MTQTQPTVPATTMVTFVGRFWRETAAGQVRLRGEIEHVQSGRRMHFLGGAGLLKCLEQFRIDTNSGYCADQDGWREVDAPATDAS